ncbi:hypothetical protein TNCV_4233851 [Trichonephila clavipes]|nr:hypothetical protein TNCV_4233851 [Trichonephila clavipes]
MVQRCSSHAARGQGCERVIENLLVELSKRNITIATRGRALPSKMMTPPENMPRLQFLIFFLSSCNAEQYMLALMVVPLLGIHDGNDSFNVLPRYHAASGDIACIPSTLCPIVAYFCNTTFV